MVRLLFDLVLLQMNAANMTMLSGGNSGWPVQGVSIIMNGASTQVFEIVKGEQNNINPDWSRIKLVSDQ